MKLHNKLDETFSRGSKVRVLRYLFREQDEHTGRGIANAVGLSPSITHAVLKELAAEGLLDIRVKGKAKLYKLREDHYVVKQILSPLFESEMKLFATMFAEIKSGILKARGDVMTIAVFGSVAEGNETVKSDLDLLVVTRNISGKKKVEMLLDKLTTGLAEKYSMALSPYILTIFEVKKSIKRKRRSLSLFLRTMYLFMENL